MDEKRLTLVGHLEELRRRTIIILLVVIIGAVASYFYIDILVDFIIQPVEDLNFIYLSPADLFLAYVKIALVSGIILTLPIILYHIWRFVLPGVTLKQKIYVVLANFMSMIFFIGGAAFAYCLILPLTIQFFTKMSRQEIKPLFSFASYVGFMSSILLSFGVTFQLPILVMLLTQFNLITPTFLKKSRKVFILLIFIIAAILTPPDIVSQVLLAAPMLVLLELSITVSSLIYKKKKA
ncbi:twin-arginine translocase subunit TatC [Clostridium formicaceticum]|uniref:Sec-independent protein translocase protein TatC n=1 Tax=Clostridium formicaceticum TaxID=1497 RepID=A0AAC9RLV8_9CLOT|nr:twin-arginine translocase subunit TatC [Clostridium formicaceticum]AOY77810.1 twin arginine-targeting protein translocase TatC [Clostridium formicaceticum]ARE88421.1 Sec-independent protein translocase protein TatCd [Clostridium formicaceticum]